MKTKQHLKDGIFTLGTLVTAFGLNLLLAQWFDTQTLIPMIFVLGVFLISWRTQGYLWGVIASLVSVLAVAILTGTLTTQIKHQEKIKAEIERERMRGNLLRAVSHDLRRHHQGPRKRDPRPKSGKRWC